MVVSLEKNTAYPSVKTLTPGGAAAACSELCEGDSILNVNGRDVYGMDAQELTPLFLGPGGSIVTVTATRPASDLADTPRSFDRNSGVYGAAEWVGRMLSHGSRSDEDALANIKTIKLNLWRRTNVIVVRPNGKLNSTTPSYGQERIRSIPIYWRKTFSPIKVGNYLWIDVIRSINR